MQQIPPIRFDEYHGMAKYAKATFRVIRENLTSEKGEKMDRGETLDEARKCVCEDRNKTYKEPEDNFNNIANYWNIFLDLTKA